MKAISERTDGDKVGQTRERGHKAMARLNTGSTAAATVAAWPLRKTPADLFWMVVCSDPVVNISRSDSSTNRDQAAPTYLHECLASLDLVVENSKLKPQHGRVESYVTRLIRSIKA